MSDGSRLEDDRCALPGPARVGGTVYVMRQRSRDTGAIAGGGAAYGRGWAWRKARASGRLRGTPGALP